MATWGDTKTTSTGGNISMKLKAGYDSVSHSGNTVYAKIYGAMTMAGNTWSKNQFGIWIPSGGTKHVVKNSGTQSKSGTWYEASQDCSWDVGTQAGGTKSVSVGFGWNGWTATQGNTASVSFSYPAASLWNDINAWNPGVTAQNGLIFNLSTSDGGSWTNITNEPSDFTKPYGTTATISNIRSNVTGAHYSSNSVTGTASSTISWTFTTANYSVEIYTAWDTYTISYNANGGTGAPGNQTKTYGTNLTLSSTKPTRANSTATGYTVTFDANGGSVSPTSKSATDTTSYTFNNWKDTGGTTYAAGGTYTKNQADTLTAQWNTSTTKGSVTTPTATRSNGTATRTVTFDATTNGGTCSTSSLNSTATITYTGNGWYTATSGGTKRCNNGASYTPTASEKVYQQWTSSTGSYSAVTLPAATKASTTSTRTVTFNANQGTTTKTSQNSTATVTYSQTGWWTASSGGTNRGNSGATYTPSAAEKVYAQFSSSTGSYSAVTLPTTSECTRSGYKLLGFATTDTATTAAYAPGASYTPSATITLYAVWQLDQAVVWVKKQLPPEYQAVEYIESTGTQYIDTGFKPNQDTRIISDFYMNTYSSGYRVPFGTRVSNTYQFFIGSAHEGGRDDWYYRYGSVNYDSSPTGNPPVDGMHHADLNKNVYTLDNFTHTFASSTFQSSHNCYIFGVNANGSVSSSPSMKLYSFLLYDNEKLIREFIPCYRKSDNIVGLYDIINDVFYTNSGTGTFTKGTNIVGSWVKGKVWVKGNIPSAYQEVEYIQTDGNQVVDIGIVGDGTTSIYDIQFAAANHRQLMGFGGNSREYWGANSGTKFELGGSGRLITETIDTTQRYKIIWTYDKTNSITKMTYSNANYSGERVDEETLTQDVTNRHYYLFNIYNNINDYTCSCKLYSLEVINRDGECLRHLVPCYRKADNVVGLYDTIGDEFYTNTISGTSLIKGSNVSNSHWVKAKKFYTKQSGAWVENKTT